MRPTLRRWFSRRDPRLATRVFWQTTSQIARQIRTSSSLGTVSAGAHALGPIVIRFRAHSGGLSTRCSVCLRCTLAARLSAKTLFGGPPPYPQLPFGPPPAPCVRAPADDDRPVALQAPAGRTPFDPEGASSAGSRDYRVLLERGIKRIPASRLLTGNIDGRSECRRLDHRFAQA